MGHGSAPVRSPALETPSQTTRWPMTMLEVESDGQALHVSWSANAWHREMDTDEQQVRLLLYRCSCDPNTGKRRPDSLVEVELPPGSTTFDDTYVETEELYGYLLMALRGENRLAVSKTIF